MEALSCTTRNSQTIVQKPFGAHVFQKSKDTAATSFSQECQLAGEIWKVNRWCQDLLKLSSSWKLSSIDELYNRLDTVKVRTRETKARSKETIQIYYTETEMQNVRG